MGTSNAYRGPKGSNPLVPSWLDGNNGTPTPTQPPSAPPGGPPVVVPGGNAPIQIDAGNSPVGGNPATGATTSFTSARTGFTRFVRSGGTALGSLRKAAAHYVRSGGARGAVRRMGASRPTATRLATFLRSASTGGLRTALADFDLTPLLGQPVEDILSALIDRICPDGGTIDEGIARNAMIETVITLLEGGIDLDALTDDQVKTAIGLFITYSIEGRLCNDIGTKITVAADSVADIASVQQELRDFIDGCVADSMNPFTGRIGNLTDNEIAGFVDEIYLSAFSILEDVTNTQNDQQ